MPLSEIYVDPSIAADSGAGTIGDPYGDLEYAIEQTTFDTTNGTRVNIQAGSTETLAADISAALDDTSVSVAWAPSLNARLVFQGYTATAGDGGVATISGGGSVGILNSTTRDFIYLADLRLTNTGANQILRLDDYCGVYRCQFDNTTGIACQLGDRGYIGSCYFTNIGGIVALNAWGVTEHCHFEDNVSNPFGTYCIQSSSGGGIIHRNIFELSSAFTGSAIVATDGQVVTHNSIWANGAAATGIQCTANDTPTNISNNLIEGFSGVGGVAIDATGNDVEILVYGANSFYDNTTDLDGSPEIHVALGSNDTLTASPFTSASTGDFSPVDTGNVKEGSLPSIIGGGLV